MEILLTYLAITTYTLVMKVAKTVVCYNTHASKIWILGMAVKIYLFPIIMPWDIIRLKREIAGMRRRSAGV